MVKTDYPTAGHVYPWFGFNQTQPAQNLGGTPAFEEMTVGSLLDRYSQGYRELQEFERQCADGRDDVRVSEAEKSGLPSC
jgi:hypothetical protein